MGGQAPDLGMFPDIASLRNWIIEAKKNLTATFEPVPGIKEERDHQITVRDGSKITVRTYEPEKSGGPLAVVYHGGGWCIGGLENEELLCRNMCGKLGMAVVNVDYRLAPEYKFPTAHNDSYDATKWVCLRVDMCREDAMLTCSTRLPRMLQASAAIRLKASSSAAPAPAATSPPPSPTLPGTRSSRLRSLAVIS